MEELISGRLKDKMNKKGVIKFGAILLVLAVFLLLVFSSFFSSALSQENYFVGEELKLDLSNYDGCSLNIKTPYGEFIENCPEKFSFLFEKEGNYIFDIKSLDSFERLEVVVYTGISSVQTINDELLISNSITNEDVQGEDIFNFESGNTYYLNTDLKFDFNGLGNYELRITSPSGKRISRLGSNDIFFFELLEEGIYSVSFIRGNGIYSYTFKVIQFQSEKLIQGKAEIGKPVGWIKKVNLLEEGNFIALPSFLDFSIKNEDGSIFTSYTLLEIDNVSYLLIEESVTEELTLEYTTSPPVVEENIISKNKKEVNIISQEDIHYENVLSYTTLPREISDPNLIKIYWKEQGRYLNFNAFDKDSNGLLDYVEWITPHLSNQTFEIIIITKADHLSLNKEFLSDIYNEVKELDNIWSEEIPDGDYIRVVFEVPLDNKRDITIFPRVISGNPIVEVYEFNSDVKIAEFNPLISNEYNKIYLTNLVSEIQDTFDLRVVGGSVEFEHIIDPYTYYLVNFTSNTTWMVPAGVYEITVEAWGGGGAGGGRPAGGGGIAGGGGGGAYAKKTFSVTPYQNYTLVIGSTVSGTSGDGATGNPTYFGNGSDLYAAGGSGGLSAGTGGDGGSVSISRGDLIYMGGKGGTANSTFSGAGGGGAGSTGIGGNASVGIAGTGTSELGGDGGAGRTTTGSGNSGNNYGGGGGGGRKGSGGAVNGGIGAAGYMRISYSTYQAGAFEVLLRTPLNTNILYSPSVVFNFTPISSATFLNCSLWDNSTGNWHRNQTNQSIIVNNTFNFINKTYSSSSGNYIWNIECCDSSNGCFFAANNYSFSFDLDAPIVNLVYPSNSSTITSDENLYFVYNVSDLSSVEDCSLYINNELKSTENSITKGINLTFNEFLDNGIYSWYVSCIDEGGRTGFSQNRTINVSITPELFTGTLYESSTFNPSRNTLAEIKLKSSQDATLNSATFDIASGGLANIVSATSQYMGYNGAVIPSGSSISFSGTFNSSTPTGKIAITWKLYVSSGGTDTLICQLGNDANSGIFENAASGTNSTCINRDIYLGPSDRLKLVINAYNTHNSQKTLTHSWDSGTNSYVVVNLTTEGFLHADLVSPLTDPYVAQEDTFDAVCQVNCSSGTCRNVNVYIQRNTSTSGWQSIGSSGNLVLDLGETNPHYLGNINNVSQNTTFTIEGNTFSSDNNIRCIAVGTYDSYNGTTTTPVTVTSAGATPPVINLTSPANLTWFNSSQITLYYNISDLNDNLANSTLILNGQKNQTNQSHIINNAINNFTISLGQGTYNWSVNATDTTNLESASNETRIFYIDLENPLVKLIYPENGANNLVNNLNLVFNVTDNMDLNLTCNIILDGKTIHSGVYVENGTNASRNSGYLSVGTHYWNVTCFDNSLRSHTSETFQFNIDDIPPEVFLITPNLWWFNQSLVSLIYNASDNNDLIVADLYLNGTYNQSNQTPIINKAYNNFTISLPDGFYNWTVNVSDDGGYSALASPRSFYVDSRNPIVYLLHPETAVTSQSSSLNFYFNATDNLDPDLICNLSVGEKVDNNILVTRNANTSRPISGLTDGLKVWNVSCVDSAGHSNISENREITIREYPKISLTTQNLSWFKENILLEYTPSDNTNLSNCSLYINNSFKDIVYTPLNNQLTNFSITDLSDGFYNWDVRCFDTYGLQNNSEIRFFYRDNSSPQIELNYPGDEAIIYSSQITFNFTVKDNLAQNMACNFTVDNNITPLIIQNNNISLITRTLISGEHFWNVSCSDLSGNYNLSETRSFTTFAPPEVILISPDSNVWLNYTEIEFEYYAYKYEEDIVNCSLYINDSFVSVNSTPIINDNSNYFNEILPQGNYTWNVYCVDSLGVIGSDEDRRLYVDTESPNISLNFPESEEILDWNEVLFNFTTFDNMAENLTCNFYINDIFYDEIIAENSEPEIYPYLLSDGEYNWTVECFDNARNYNISETRNFTVYAPPKITLYTPDDDLYGFGSSVTFHYLAEDAQIINNCTLYIDGVPNESKSSAQLIINPNFTISGIPEGLHNWTVECFDTNTPIPAHANATSKYFSMDFSPPSIILNSPENNSGIDFNEDRVYFNWTAIDALDNLLQCNLTIDGIVRRPNVLVTSNISKREYVLTSILGQGEHWWNITCWDQMRNTNISESRKFNITYPDFYINSSEIFLNETSPVENQSVEIIATVRNLGGVNISNVTIQFYAGDPDLGGIKIGQNIFINISGFIQKNVSTNWLAPMGSSEIFVIVDPPLSTNGSYVEINESNNKASKIINVGSWNFFYGDVLSFSNLVLADNGSSKLINWTAQNFESGNVYVADYDSSVSWIDLQAIGKTESNSDSSSDFSELDSLLNSSSYADSIYSVYTNSGNPKFESNIYSFGNLIQGVPVINSTNNSNFITGILWDMSDDILDGEFDVSDKEDIVFISPIMKQTLGNYGTYDYEMRVPAKLREYYTADSRTAIFYVEIS